MRLLHQAWDLFSKGDVLSTDRAFGDYVTLAAVSQREVDVVARLSGARKVDFRKAVKLIRCLMAEAVAEAGVLMTWVSFKGTVDAVRNYSAEMRAARSKGKREELWTRLVATLAADLVPERPGRREPRAVKRRPKPFPLLNKPRRQFKDIPHRNRYWKNNPRKIRA